MEQAETNNLQLSNLQCNNHNTSKLLCCKQNCFNCALVCRHQTCNCLPNQHLECEFVYTETIVKKVKNKKRTLTKELEQGFKAVEKVYESAIQSLSKDKENLLLWKENYGLNEDQIKFINALIENNRTELNGNLVNRVKIGLCQQNEKGRQWFNKKAVKKFWKRQQQKFEQIRNNLTKFYLSSVKFNEQNDIKLDFSLDASKNFKMDQKTNIITKCTTNNYYSGLVGQTPLKNSKKISFDFSIINSQNRCFMIGIVTQNGRNISADAYQSTQTIFYFARDGRLFNEGASKQLGKPIKQGQKVKVQINKAGKQISWYSNGNLLGSAPMKDKFLNNNIYVMIEAYKEDDSFRLGKYDE